MAERLGLSLERSAPGEGLAQSIQLPAGLSQADSLRFLLENRYRIQEDDKRLREAVHGRSSAEVRDNFDALRKHYRERRELAGSRVEVPGADPRQCDLATALGCKLVTVEA